MQLKIQQWMMRYLRRKGWIVFWLDPISRTCNSPEVCWLQVYMSDIKNNS